MVTVKQIEYKGWPHCYQISDGNVEVIVTTDVGPRIIRCGFVGGCNLFAEFPDQLGLTGGDSWRIYGGHRLWHSPETKARTYFPDNSSVVVELLPNGLRLNQMVESTTGIAKSIQITLDATTHLFTVEHRLTNRGVWPVTLAPWALSVMQPGGVAIIPQYRDSDDEGLLHNRVLALWPYTDMNDARVTWGSKYILLRQDPTIKAPFKLGISAPQGWMAYLNNGNLFFKSHDFDWHCHPDGGVNLELYTNDVFLELETLGALKNVAPEETVSHTEYWSLFKDIGSIDNEADIEKQIKNYLTLC